MLGRYICLGLLALALVALLQLEVPAGMASNTGADKYLSLEAQVSSRELRLGDVLKTELTIRNRSARTVSFVCMKPLIVQPVIWKDSSKGTLNGGSSNNLKVNAHDNKCVDLTISQYNLAVAPEKQTLKPGEVFSFAATDVVVYDGNLDYKTPSNRPVAFWLATPGHYRLRCSVTLASNDQKTVSGVLLAKDVLIEVKTQQK